MQKGDGFPEDVNEDGEVEIPYEIHHTDTLGSEVTDFGDHTTCDCDPIETAEIVGDIEEALTRSPRYFSEAANRTKMCRLHADGKRCSECVPEDLFARFEDLLDTHGILRDGDGC